MNCKETTGVVHSIETVWLGGVTTDCQLKFNFRHPDDPAFGTDPIRAEQVNASEKVTCVRCLAR